MLFPALNAVFVDVVSIPFVCLYVCSLDTMTPMYHFLYAPNTSDLRLIDVMLAQLPVRTADCFIKVCKPDCFARGICPHFRLHLHVSTFVFYEGH